MKYLKSFSVVKGLGARLVCKMNSYSLYRRSQRVIFLPFTKSKGTQNVSRGIRLPKPRKEFHALTKESFSDALIISSHLLPLRGGSMRGVCGRWSGQRWNTRATACCRCRLVSSLCCDNDLFIISLLSISLHCPLTGVIALFFLFFVFQTIVSSVHSRLCFPCLTQSWPLCVYLYPSWAQWQWTG